MTAPFDRFNAAIQELIRDCEEAGERDLALAFAQLKLDANKKFHQWRHAEHEQDAGFPVLPGRLA